LENEILEKLSGGDLRSEGRAEEVALEIINNPSLLAALVEGLHSDDKVIRGRTCMTMEVVSRKHPDLLVDTIPQLIKLAAKDTVSQIRWHIAEVFGNVPISSDEIEQIIPILLEYLSDKSKIVKYCAVQTLGIIGNGSLRRGEIVSRISVLENESKGLTKAVHKALEALKNLGEEYGV
jgi:HEAT repeat protein